MNSATTPAFQLCIPGEQNPVLTATGILMCVPVAIAAAYYSGIAGCTYGLVKSIYARSALVPVEVQIIKDTPVIATRNISHCVSDPIFTGCQWAVSGFCSGCCTGALSGICSAEYVSQTGRRLPDIEMTLSLPPRFQYIERT